MAGVAARRWSKHHCVAASSQQREDKNAYVSPSAARTSAGRPAGPSTKSPAPHRRSLADLSSSPAGRRPVRVLLVLLRLQLLCEVRNVNCAVAAAAAAIVAAAAAARSSRPPVDSVPAPVKGHLDEDAPQRGVMRRLRVAGEMRDR